MDLQYPEPDASQALKKLILIKRILWKGVFES